MSILFSININNHLSSRKGDFRVKVIVDIINMEPFQNELIECLFTTVVISER
uniref:Uncharacterized protein n=1 Tax=Anguilla anguilla TaxID=7936 RepID=A0A0E9QZ91_ANGAN